ncbi:uncharacterized protein [Macrobrachium rosenbergii]|uniref:uncharacterized protein n=1 Tax=Macrobrachium rosenbergii TaxID=79674 RepID=UPI0034D47357
MSSSAHSSISSGSRGIPPALPPPNGPNLVPLNMVLTPKNLLKKYKLPTAAHLLTPTAPPGLDLSRPLLLYNTYNSIKVRGVSLKPGRDGSLTPVGPTIVIPDSYSGWFSIVGNDGQMASFYSTVEQVANSQVTFFLTRYDVPAYTNTEDGDGRIHYQKTIVQSGHVLKFMGVYEDLNVQRSNSRRPQDASSVFNCDKYAQCLNYRNEVVFLPFSASGRFYTTAHKNSKNSNHVYLMAHILKNHKLPITVRLVCGYMPRVPCSFTGLLRLEKQQKEAVILACTMTNEADATLFEIDVSSNFVLKPVKDPMFPKTPIFLKTVSYCEDEADAWRRQIKVTHHVTEKRSRSLTRSLSDKFVEPLANVRPLSLSFLADPDKKKNREREKSQDGKPPPVFKDKSKDKTRDHKFREFRSRDKQTEKTKFKYHDRSGSFSGFPLKDQILAKKNSDGRKVSKQNTYVLQNGKSSKHQEKKGESEGSLISNRSVENMDYSRVIDDISPIPESSDEGENPYAEICDYGLRSPCMSDRGPISLPNLSLFNERDEVSSNISRCSSKDNDSIKKRLLCKSKSSTESIRSRLSILNRGSSLDRDNFMTKEILSESRSSSVNGIAKINVVHKTTKVDQDNYITKESKGRTRSPSEKSGSKISIVSTETNLIQHNFDSLKENLSHSNDNALDKDKVNEVYIIRVVVKDEEEDRMSTLTKSSSGGIYMKIRGFEVPKEELSNGITSSEVNSYDSVC